MAQVTLTGGRFQFHDIDDIATSDVQLLLPAAVGEQESHFGIGQQMNFCGPSATATRDRAASLPQNTGARISDSATGGPST
jgi:hypothetical protein